ncbi:MAG: hypothetical protein D6800_02925, partial [Candidatus Zixiibacteriota bacterium]
NRAPVISVPGPQVVTAQNLLSFTVTATDPDNTVPQLSLANPPAGAVFTDNLDGTGSFSWTPTVSDTGLYNLLFIASDGELADSGTVAVQVLDTGSCCHGTTGNVNNDPADIVDVADLTTLIDNLFISFTPLSCPAEANVNGDQNGVVDVADLTTLIDHLFISFTPLPTCP